MRLQTRVVVTTNGFLTHSTCSALQGELVDILSAICRLSQMFHLIYFHTQLMYVYWVTRIFHCHFNFVLAVLQMRNSWEGLWGKRYAEGIAAYSIQTQLPLPLHILTHARTWLYSHINYVLVCVLCTIFGLECDCQVTFAGLPLLVPMHGVWGKATGGLVQVFNCCSDEWRTAMFVLKKEAGSCEHMFCEAWFGPPEATLTIPCIVNVKTLCLWQGPNDFATDIHYRRVLI